MGAVARDYHGDNPRGQGKCARGGTPHAAGRVPGGPRCYLSGGLLFTSCHFKVAKWTEQNINSNEKAAIISPVASFLGGHYWKNIHPKDHVYSAAAEH